MRARFKDFCTLGREAFVESLFGALDQSGFDWREVTLEEVQEELRLADKSGRGPSLESTKRLKT